MNFKNMYYNGNKLRERNCARNIWFIIKSFAVLALLALSAPVANAAKIISVSGNLNFGDVALGTSAQRTMTISNSGNATLQVSSIVYPTGFSGSPSSGSVHSRQKLNITVTFAPMVATNYSGLITIQSDATSGNNTIAVSGRGTGILPTRIISLGGELNFRNVFVGTNAQRTLFITNSGTTTLTVSNITLPTGFTGSFSGTIAAGTNKSLTITFSPAAVTNYSGTVTVKSDATSGINTNAISGTGISAATRIISLGGNLSFGSV